MPSLTEPESIQADLHSLKNEEASFRDREARIVYLGERVIRLLNAKATEDWQQLTATDFYKNAMSSGQCVGTTELGALEFLDDAQTAFSFALEHERIPFVSYPYEWSFSMLKDAALLQLELTISALESNIALKDASAYNIQWVGHRPQFIDMASFETYSEGQPWKGHRQFCQLFLFPLMLNAYKDLPFQPWLRSYLDGIPSAHMAKLFQPLDALFKKGVLVNILLHAHLETMGANSHGNSQVVSLDKAIVIKSLQKMHALVSQLEWKASRSTWGDYDNNNTYADPEREAKEAFVAESLQATGCQNKLTWDLGCNTGRYSKIASKFSENVLACDFDHLAIERLYQHLKQQDEYKNITPFILDLSNPSPGQGWGGLERKAFDQRTKPTFVLMLAAIHHIVITHNIRLLDVLMWLKSLNAHVVIEFVNRDDEMTQILLKNKSIPFDDYSLDNFEAIVKREFEVKKEAWVSKTRKLYFLAPR